MTRILSIAALVLSAIALILTLSRGSDPEEHEEKADTSGLKAEATELGRRVSALEATVASLAAQMASSGKPQGPAPEPPPSGDRPTDQVQALRSQVDELKEKLRASEEATPVNRPQQIIAARVKRFAGAARLSESQEREVSALLTAEAEKRLAFRDGMRAGTLDPSAAADIHALRDQTNQDVKRILSPDQYAQFEKMRQDERRSDGPLRQVFPRH